MRVIRNIWLSPAEVPRNVQTGTTEESRNKRSHAWTSILGGLLPKSPHSEDQSCVVRPDGNMEICPLLRGVVARHPGGLPRSHDEVTKIIRELERVEIKTF